MADKQYFFRSGGVVRGPVSAGKLKALAASGRLRPEDLVWEDGSDVQHPARQFKGLFAAPPPLPTAGPPPLPPKPSLLDRGRAAGQAALPFLQKAWAETRETARQTGAQTARLAQAGQALIQERALAAQASAAQLALGERLEALGLGDADLRAQLAFLPDRIRSLQAAKSSPKHLEAEQRGLRLRLAEPFLRQETPPPGAEAAHAAARTTRAALADHQARQAQARQALLPADEGTRWRVVVGTGVAAVLGLVVLWGIVSPSRPRVETAQGSGVTGVTGGVGRGGVEPEAAPPEPVPAGPADPQKARDLVAHGDAAREKEDFDRAIRLYTAALRADPNLATAFLGRCRAYIGKGDLDKALADGNEAVRKDDRLAEAYLWRGGVLLDKQQPDKALADMEAALARNPKLDQAYYFRGLARYQKGQVAEALAELGRAIDLKPLLAYFVSRGEILAEQGRNQEALNDANLVLQNDANHVGAMVLRGQIFLNAYRIPQALTDLNRAVQLDSKSANAFGWRSRAHYMLGNYRPAAADADKAIALNPDAPWPQILRGMARERLNDLDRAAQDIAAALKKAPDLAIGQVAHGNLLARQGQADQALTAYGRAIELAPNFPESYEERAKLLRRLGRGGEAQNDEAKVRKLKGQ